MRLWSIYPMAALIFSTAPALAAITINSVSGASHWELRQQATGANPGTGAPGTGAVAANPIIYGGTAGDLSAGDCANASENSTCNNCTADLVACNDRRIHPDLFLEINFTSNQTNGRPVINTAAGAPITNIERPPNVVARGTATFIRVRWSILCSALDTASVNCDRNFNGSIRVGIDSGTDDVADDPISISLVIHDPDGGAAATTPADVDTVLACDASPAPENGICDWEAFPGDKKIYLRNLDPAGNFPNNANLNFNAVRVFSSTAGFQQANPVDGKAKDISIATDSDGFELTNKIVSGLSNKTLYYFRIALVDPARNVSHFTDDQVLADACPDPVDDATCPFTATPDKVVGMLNEDINCFVTTAAYGSSFERHVETFREFRNDILLTRPWGQKFVKSYYDWGPRLARWTAEAEWRRALARVVLWPAWVFAELSLSWGLPMASFAFLLMAMAPLLVFWGQWRLRRS